MSPQANLLDLVAKRYPGTRPSDLYGRQTNDNPDGLDDYQAFQLDVALALRGDLEDRDKLNETLYVLLEGMRGIMKAQGAKPSKMQKPRKNFEPREPGEPEEPMLDDLLAALGGQGVKLDNG